jgi:NADPH2:quinone reductase
MKAVVLRDTGAPERLEYGDVPPPEPGDGQKRVHVRAAGINYLDLLVRQGRYPQAPPLPTIPGVEVAGEADGRRILGLVTERAGGYAELACVDEEWLFPLPEGASFEEGASFLMTYLTAYLPLARLTPVGPSSTVLVHAAAGGVGSAAVQLARHLGARVLATASSEEKRELARELGADEAYGYGDFAGSVRADVVIDPVGGRVLTESLRAVNPLGALVAVGYAGGPWEDVSPALLVGRNVALHGFYLGRLIRHRPDVVRAAAEELLRLWEQGAVRPLVGSRYPLADAAEAHRLMEQRRHVGKVVLVP